MKQIKGEIRWVEVNNGGKVWARSGNQDGWKTLLGGVEKFDLKLNFALLSMHDQYHFNSSCPNTIHTTARAIHEMGHCTITSYIDSE